MPLAPPPRDSRGKVTPHDHDGIAAGDTIIRRVSDKQIVVDENGRQRLSTLAFKPSSDGGMSVDLEAQIIEANLDPKIYVITPRWVGSVKLNVGLVRSQGLTVGYDPLPENPHHGEVWGHSTRAQQLNLQSIAEWYVPIPDVMVV